MMKKEDELLAIADVHQLIAIEQKLLALKDICLEPDKIVEIVNLVHDFEAIHLQRLRDGFMYRDKIEGARDLYRALQATCATLRADNRELKKKLNVKFENM